MTIETIQAALRDSGFDGWLFYDHHNRDPLSYSILGLPANQHVTRRWFYFVPAIGEPRKLVHRIENLRLDSLPGEKLVYSSWQELEAQLEALVAGATTIAMQYSPRNAIMYVSMVDAGTVEVLRGFGKQIVSSADLVSQFEAVLSDEQIASHFAAQQILDPILDAAWKHIGDRVRSGGRVSPGSIDEFGVITFLQEKMHAAGLLWEHGPNCSVGPNAADSHYEPPSIGSRPIQSGDFVLIDVWGKFANDPKSVWYDITWTGVVDREPTQREQEIFRIVTSARDAAIKTIEDAYSAHRAIPGWEADDAARAVIRQSGFAEYFTHRTGHNISPVLHGPGAHLDNLETHDERLLLPNTCFSVEPGLYFPGEFGIRSEVNMITQPSKAVVTGRIQKELVKI